MTKDTNALEPDYVMGTPVYMPPEALQKGNDLDGRSDLYSLALVGVFLLTGKDLFKKDDLEKTIDAQINESPVALSVIMGNKVSPDFDQLILSCLEKNMAERPASARDLYEALERCQPSQDWTRTRAEEWWKEQDKRRSALPSDENSLESSMRTLSIDLMSPRTQKLLDRST